MMDGEEGQKKIELIEVYIKKLKAGADQKQIGEKKTMDDHYSLVNLIA